MYIYKLPDWPCFTWDKENISELLSEVFFLQKTIIIKARSLGFSFQQEVALENMTDEITKSSKIEGKIFNAEQVRASIARRLNVRDDGLKIPSNRYIDGAVEMMIDATRYYKEEVTLDRLYRWHALLFPNEPSGTHHVKPGQLRDDQDGPMQVVSTNKWVYAVSYNAPSADKLPAYLSDFLNWMKNKSDTDPIIRAAIAHLWFITLHPFDDGNGRIARALTDLMLARAEDTPHLFYSMSAQIQKSKKEYYKILERTQKGTMDITEWLEWFLRRLIESICYSIELANKMIRRQQFQRNFGGISLDDNQLDMIDRLFNDFKGHLTVAKWAKIYKCSKDDAYRSIGYLINNNILQQEGDGKSTHYKLSESAWGTIPSIALQQPKLGAEDDLSVDNLSESPRLPC